MEATIAICTWNRAGLLAKTLDRLSAMDVPSEVDWEVVVVDNGSTDGTGTVLEAFSARLPLRRVQEKSPGLSHARNAAVRHSRGECIVWTDDDVLVDSDWLAAYLEASHANPGMDFFGGPVEPWFEEEPPPWLPACLHVIPGIFALVNHGDKPMELSEGRLPWGANFAVRRSVQEAFPYDPALGRRRDSLRSGEEEAVFRALLARGHRGLWVPRARVRHLIPAERQTEEFIRKRMFAQGRDEGGGDDYGRRQLFGRPLWAWRDAFLEEIRYRLHRTGGDPDRWVRHLGRAAKAQGVLLRGNRSGGVDPRGGT